VSSLWGVLRCRPAAPADGAHISNGHANETDTQGDLTDHESDASELSPPNGPLHLKQLFDNGMVNTGEDAWTVTAGLNAGLADTGSLSGARKQLQRLLPPREEMSGVVVYSHVWTSIYNGMFSTLHPVKTGEELLAQYDDLLKQDADPTAIANALLSLTLTGEQVADEEMLRSAPSMHVSTRWKQRVITAVEKLIINNDRVACTLRGIETTLMFVRLSLAIVDIRKVWLLLRRAIAIAELIGLPRISKMYEAHRLTGKTMAADQREHYESATVLWHSMRSIERMAGTLFNLPVGTAIYPMHHAPSVLKDGSVSYPAYMGRMADIVAGVQDLDDIMPSAQSESDRLFKVLRIDSDLKQLAGQPPASWWQLPPADVLQVDHLLQMFHQYYLARTHIQLALSDDATGRYNYSYTTCLTACKNVAYRYVALRLLVPAGFFFCRVVDLQIITCAVFLLFTMRKQDSSSTSAALAAELKELMGRVVGVLDAVKDRSGSDFAKKALEALRSLDDLMEGTADEEGEITLHVPLLGKVHVSRKGANPQTLPAMQSVMTNNHATAVVPQDPSEYSNLPAYDGLLPDLDMGWSMDVMDDSPLMPLDTWNTNNWLPDVDYNNGFASYPL